MKITLCGSIKFVREMREAASQLKKKGHDVLLPLSAELNQGKDYWNNVKSSDARQFFLLKGERMRNHFSKIIESDAILVLNYDKDGKKNYIGPNTLAEMAIAFEHNKRIFVLNEPPDCDASDEIMSMRPLCLKGDMARLE